jgi:hypothetical protein
MNRPALVALLLAIASCSSAPRAGERPAESAADAERLTAFLKANMHSRGQAKMDRIELDEVQRLCNATGDNPPREQAARIEQAQLKEIPYPSGGLLGDWKAGEKIAQSGRAYFGSESTGSSDWRMRVPSRPWHETQEKSHGPARWKKSCRPSSYAAFSFGWLLPGLSGMPCDCEAM